MRQITILTPPDRPGTLADITELLGSRQINITDFEVTDDHAHALFQITAEPYDLALRVLTEAGYHAVSEDALLIRVPDAPGAIARVAACFREPQINVRSLRILQRAAGESLLALVTDDNARAKEFIAEWLVGS